MVSRLNLLAILLILICVVHVLESSRSNKHQKGQGYVIERNVLKRTHNKSESQNAISLREKDKKVIKKQMGSNILDLWKTYVQGGDRPRRRNQKMDRTMMALLMAYKMKFVALIPTMVGGLILLKATALLAGFFFALFAAVLGLKVR